MHPDHDWLAQFKRDEKGLLVYTVTSLWASFYPDRLSDKKDGIKFGTLEWCERDAERCMIWLARVPNNIIEIALKPTNDDWAVVPYLDTIDVVKEIY